MRKKHISRWHLPLVAVLALVGTILPVGPAWAASCSVAGSVLTVTLSGGTTTVAKSATNLTVTGCANVALSTVNNVKINSGSSGDTLVFDLNGGLFDDGTDVSFELALGDGSDSVVFTGTPEKDEVSLGDENILVGFRGTAQISWTDFDQSGIDSADLNGGDGPDFLLANGVRSGSAWPVPVTLDGEAGNDTLIGGEAADALNGDEDHDRLDGGLGADVENGDAGNDTFAQDDESNGGDDLFGGEGRDRVDYGRRASAVSVTVGAGTNNDGQTQPAEGDDVTGVERLLGGDGNDTLTGATSPSDPQTAPKHQMDGGDGNDTLTGGPGADSLTGGDGDDTLNGEAGDANALAAACTVAAKFCRDIIIGGAGNDTANGGPGSDSFHQERSADGNDVISGGGDSDTLRYSSRTGNLTIRMDGVSNSGDLTAGEADDIGSDVENVITGSGNDVVEGNGNANRITLGSGTDEASGGDGDDRILGGSGDDTLEGEEGNDTLFGGGGKDELDGGAGSNKIYGGSGFDTCTSFTKKVSCP